MHVATGDARYAEVWAELECVSDPELDQSVAELGFIDACEIDADAGVYVAYRLPTYWCAANFAFMMGHDMKERLSALPWAAGVRVELLDHFYAQVINRGLADDASFEATCAGEAAGGLAEIRATFRYKAFMARQERLLAVLRRDGWSDTDMTALTVAGLAALDLDVRAAHLRERYLALRRGHTPGDFSAQGYRGDADEWAFVDATGMALTAGTLDAHLRRLRSTRLNAEFNASLCTSVLAARKRERLQDSA